MTNEFDFNVKQDDYEEWFSQISQTEENNCLKFSAPDPYAKCVRSQESSNRISAKTDADGNIHADNLFAYWIPQLTLQKEIGGTVYTVTGYYEGKTDFIRKLERMIVDRMHRAMEGDTDDK